MSILVDTDQVSDDTHWGVREYDKIDVSKSDFAVEKDIQVVYFYELK
ncbi:hypothetical protein [Algoriphagus ratkowskyi]|nr:hypothetical protein [Algoriphagus ratkowskyi]